MSALPLNKRKFARPLKKAQALTANIINYIPNKSAALPENMRVLTGKGKSGKHIGLFVM